ncbi:hypothetical protein GcC1_134013, partial [Golovinomyces cichoracearum]
CDIDLQRELIELRQRVEDGPSQIGLTDRTFPKVKIEKVPEKKDYRLKPQKFPTYRGDRVTYENSKFNTPAREMSMSGKERGFVGDVDSSGDTFMGGINSAEVVRGPNGKHL